MLKRTLVAAGVLAALVSVAAADPATGQATGKRHYKPVATTVIYQSVAPGGLAQSRNTSPRYFHGPVNRFSQGRRTR